MIECKIYKPDPVKHKRKASSNKNKTLFDKKAIEFINLPSIIHDPIVRSSIPSNISNFDLPPVVINLEKNIHSRIFNLIRFCPTLMLRDFFKITLPFHLTVNDLYLLTNAINIF